VNIGRDGRDRQDRQDRRDGIGGMGGMRDRAGCMIGGTGRTAGSDELHTHKGAHRVDSIRPFPACPGIPACPAFPGLLFCTGAGAPPPARTDADASPRRCLAAPKRGRRRSRPARPARYSPCIVKDDPKRHARTRRHGAHTVAHGYAIRTACAFLRPLASGEDHARALIDR